MFTRQELFMHWKLLLSLGTTTVFQLKEDILHINYLFKVPLKAICFQFNLNLMLQTLKMIPKLVGEIMYRLHGLTSNHVGYYACYFL